MLDKQVKTHIGVKLIMHFVFCDRAKIGDEASGSEARKHRPQFSRGHFSFFCFTLDGLRKNRGCS